MQQTMHGNVVIREHESQHYITVFNKDTGFFVRAEGKGYDEPFWSQDGPELLDFSITNYCEHNCRFCYRQSNIKGLHASLDDVRLVISEASKCGVLQIALGGGNPNQHPQFVDILRLIRENEIIPSYTTNGDGLTDKILEATKEYCGAMAISLYPPYAKVEVIAKRIHEMGIKLNLHVILTTETIDTLTKWLITPPTLFRYINAVIILNYKPIVKDCTLLIEDHSALQKFYHAVSTCTSVKIGFDSCCVPGIVTYMPNINQMLIDSCEAARFSAFISEDLKMYPCSFMASTEFYGDLRKHSLTDIWKNDSYFIHFRNKIRQGMEHCHECSHVGICKGGCRYLPAINQCENMYY